MILQQSWAGAPFRRHGRDGTTVEQHCHTGSTNQRCGRSGVCRRDNATRR